jgi:hypothetical protein
MLFSCVSCQEKKSLKRHRRERHDVEQDTHANEHLHGWGRSFICIVGNCVTVSCRVCIFSFFRNGHREEMRGETVVGREEEITFIRQSEYASSLVTVQRDL